MIRLTIDNQDLLFMKKILKEQKVKIFLYNFLITDK